jgi:hypothetical protein
MKKPKQARTKGLPDWIKQVQWDLELAKRILLDHGGMHPMFMIHFAGKITVVTSNVSHEHREQLYAYLTTLCVAKNAVALSFVAEAWVRTVPDIPGETKEENIERALAVMPRDAEDRIEVLLSQITYRDEGGDNHSIMRSAEIERGADGKVSGFKPDALPQDDDAKDEGMVFRILPSFIATPELQAKAQEALPKLAALLGLKSQDVPIVRH